VDPEKENKQYSDQLGAKKNQMMSRQSPSKLCLASDNDKEKLVEYKQMNKHSDHYWGQCCSKTVSDLVNFSSN